MRSHGCSPPEGLRVLPEGPLPSREDREGRCKPIPDAKPGGAWIWTCEPTKVWEIQACFRSCPVHGSSAVTAGRDEDPDFSSHHVLHPGWHWAAPPWGPAHSTASQRVYAVSAWSQGCSPQPYTVTQPAENTSTWLPKYPTVSLRMRSKNWPFPNSSCDANVHPSLETAPLAVFTSVPLWDVLFLSRTFSYPFLNPPNPEWPLSNLHIFIHMSSLMLGSDQIPLK